MQTYLNKTMAFLRDEDGATAIEYALLVALIALAITAAVTGLGESISNIFEKSSAKLNKVKP